MADEHHDYRPSLQVATFVLSSGYPAEQWQRFEAYEFATAWEPAEPLSLEVRAVAYMQPHDYSETRGELSWGASGPYIQEIVMVIGTSVAANVISAPVVDRLKRFRAARSARKTAFASEYRTTPAEGGADAAWRLFENFVARAFKAQTVEAVEVTRKGDSWSIRAYANDGRHFLGTVADEGRVLWAKLDSQS